MRGRNIAALVAALLLVLAGALVGLSALLPDPPPTAPKRIDDANDRLLSTCFRADLPLPGRQRAALDADARALANELREHPDQTYRAFDDSDPDYTLRNLVEEVADATGRNPACRPQTRTLTRALDASR